MGSDALAVASRAERLAGVRDAVDAVVGDDHVEFVLPAYLATRLEGPAPYPHALVRVLHAGAHRGHLVRTPDDVMSAALVLVRATQAPTHQQVEYFSQRNCELLGLTKRGFLELLRRPDAPSVSAIGKLRLVRRDVMLAFLERLGAKSKRAAEHDADGADVVLREIGCAAVRQGRS